MGDAPGTYVYQGSIDSAKVTANGVTVEATAKADTEGVNSLHKTAQNKSADRYITKSDSSICTVFAL